MVLNGRGKLLAHFQDDISFKKNCFGLYLFEVVYNFGVSLIAFSMGTRFPI